MSSYASILVGTDGSDSSFRAVDKAAALAHDAGATLVIVCAYRTMSERERKQAANQLGDLAYKVQGANPAESIVIDAAYRAQKAGATSIEQVAVEGEPVDVIIDTAKKYDVDLVVVGNRGLNSLAGRILGSVPQNVSHKASADVLIVHTVD
jgi:nucleotide-binding universal stress UspA family protein